MTTSAAVPALRFRLRREHGLLLLFLAVSLFLSVSVPNFATPRNLLLLLRTQGYLAVLATGMTLVVLTGGIDLSVGSVVALTAVAMGIAWKATGSAPAVLLTALGVGALCGAVNGLLIAAGRVPPLIVTLATLSVFRGLAFALGGSKTVGHFPALVLAFSRYDVAGLPAPLWTAVALLVGTGIYLACTDGGRAIYAAGANPAAARLSGVPVDWLKFRLYLVSGILAGLTAIMYAGQYDSVRADIGQGYELLAVTIVVLGGTSVAGGEGSLVGTAIAFLTLVFINNGITLRGLPDELHGLVVAVLLVTALLMDAGFRRRAGRVQGG